MGFRRTAKAGERNSYAMEEHTTDFIGRHFLIKPELSGLAKNAGLWGGICYFGFG